MDGEVNVRRSLRQDIHERGHISLMMAQDRNGFLREIVSEMIEKGMKNVVEFGVTAPLIDVRPPRIEPLSGDSWVNPSLALGDIGVWPLA